MKRWILSVPGVLLVLGLLVLPVGCAGSGSSSTYRSRNVYRGGSVHYNSFPSSYEYRGRMGMPY